MTLLDVHQAPARPAPPRDRDRLKLVLHSTAAAVFEVPLGKLRARSRGTAQVAFARQSAMYLAHVALGQSYSAAGALFRRDRTTAAYACALVEDKRDDPLIDRQLALLEELCLQALDACPREVPE